MVESRRGDVHQDLIDDIEHELQHRHAIIEKNNTRLNAHKNGPANMGYPQ
jgi:hypothetical protein